MIDPVRDKQEIRRSSAEESMISVIQLNCSGLYGKLTEIKILVYSRKPDIVCLSETWMSENSQLPYFIGYDIRHLSRNAGNRARGGLMILVRKDIKFKDLQINRFNNGKLEIHGIVLSSVLGDISVLNIYNPNEAISTGEFLHYINQFGDKYLMFGDFNAHSPLWDERGRSNSTGKSIEDTMNQCNVQLLNDGTPTYIDRRHSTTSCLDLCLISNFKFKFFISAAIKIKTIYNKCFALSPSLSLSFSRQTRKV